MRAREEFQCVYFAQAAHMIKVGCSIDPEKRLTQIAEWVPFRVELVAVTPGSFRLEADLHAYFADSWSHLEWFHITPKIMEVVRAINAGEPLLIPACPRDTGKELHKTLKKRATRRITHAENAAFGWMTYPERRKRRPAYLVEAIESFEGAHQLPPSGAALAAIARYESELADLAKALAA